MIKIYHNPRCRKSREGLAILENSGEEFEIVKYLENPPTKIELFELIKLLNISPIELIRKGEVIWKENFKNKPLTDEQIVDAMINFPKLIERPIVIKNNKAVIGRPPTLIKEFI
ncbi:arsenate reductase (glutaredoxin) [Urechidicola croceus]|uniref:Arsenate reductase (Glutaredoxin) n=1 Tax=Urechidicola croceus TaxID=1850246 RepID=A0A1D8P4D4_9FLAO|nr:arsenate reductase (glutaredoxin) [Urechidicola croceus]AOW19450.1 arsenate reductase (glutaredoxin) [Urechidicola croceus]